MLSNCFFFRFGVGSTSGTEYSGADPAPELSGANEYGGRTSGRTSGTQVGAAVTTGGLKRKLGSGASSASM